MTTLTILLGNNDKLTQSRWSAFIQNINQALEEIQLDDEIKYQFTGSSEGHQPWQNYCLVINVQEETIPKIKDDLTLLLRAYDQDSIAITEAPVEFLR